MRDDRLAAFSLGCALVALVAAPSSAATRHVPWDYPTIIAAIDASSFGDSVLVAPGTYTYATTRMIDLGGSFLSEVTSLVILKDGVKVIGTGGPEATILDLSQATIQGSGFVVVGGLFESGETLLRGFTVTGAPAGGRGMFASYGELVVVEDCIFRDLDSTPRRGAGVSMLACSLVMNRCRVENCRAANGGGVYVDSASLWMRDCDVVGCVAEGGGGVAVRGSGFYPNQTFEAIDCSFVDNTATESGCGALSCATVSFPTQRVEGCWFEGNRAAAAGAVCLTNGFPTVLRGNVFLDNESTGSNGIAGGALVGGWATIESNTFHRNSEVSSYPGSALAIDHAELTFRNNLFTENAGGEAVSVIASVVQSMGCNVYWDNPGGEIGGYPLDETDRIVDPLYCDPESGNLTLSFGSPCLPEGAYDCGLIGALGQGCGTVSVESDSWARIKARYRER